MDAWAGMPQLEKAVAKRDALRGEAGEAGAKLSARLKKYMDDDKAAKVELKELRLATYAIQHKLDEVDRAGEQIKMLSERQWRIFNQPKPMPVASNAPRPMRY